MKLLLLMLMFAVTSSVHAFSEIADTKKRKAIDYSVCSVYFYYLEDKEKEEFFNEYGPEFVDRVKNSKNKRLRKWKNQIKIAKQHITTETNNNLTESVLTSKYGKKCNSIYARSKPATTSSVAK